MFQEYGRKILCYLLSNQLYLFYVHLHRKNLVINLLYFLAHQTFALRYVDREKLVNISLESSCRFMEGAVAFPLRYSTPCRPKGSSLYTGLKYPFLAGSRNSSRNFCSPREIPRSAPACEVYLGNYHIFSQKFFIPD